MFLKVFTIRVKYFIINFKSEFSYSKWCTLCDSGILCNQAYWLSVQIIWKLKLQLLSCTPVIVAKYEFKIIYIWNQAIHISITKLISPVAKDLRS